MTIDYSISWSIQLSHQIFHLVLCSPDHIQVSQDLNKKVILLSMLIDHLVHFSPSSASQVMWQSTSKLLDLAIFEDIATITINTDDTKACCWSGRATLSCKIKSIGTRIHPCPCINDFQKWTYIENSFTGVLVEHSRIICFISECRHIQINP